VKGQHEAAVSHFERALALEARIGARPLQARTLYHFALTLAQDGRRRDRARDLVVESRAIADDLRMRTLLSQIEAASRQFPELA
jgi:hypothetical protein